MKRSSRLSVALHLLLHMAEQPDRPLTSEHLAACPDTNPVVVRRIFAGLREAGILASTKGHGGGWQLARLPEDVSLAQIQEALDERLIGMGSNHAVPGCLVEQAVNNALDQTIQEAERLLTARLATISLADLLGDVRRRKAKLPPCRESHHAG